MCKEPFPDDVPSLLIHRNLPQACEWASLLGDGGASALGKAGLEAVPELSRNVAEFAHATGTGGLSPLGLVGPVDCISHFCQLYLFPFIQRQCLKQLAALASDGIFVVLSIGSSETYTSGSWQRGSRTRSRCASGCGETGGLQGVHQLVLLSFFRHFSTAVSSGESREHRMVFGLVDSLAIGLVWFRPGVYVPQRRHRVCVLL